MNVAVLVGAVAVAVAVRGVPSGQPSAGGPGWTDILTAGGTVGAVMVALGIAWWSDRRLRQERAQEKEELEEERRRSAAALTEQRAHEKAALEEERAYSRAQLEEERRLALDREQLLQASSVRVRLASRRAPGDSPETARFRQLAALVENKGDYTVTRVTVRFFLDNGGQMLTLRRSEPISRSPDSARLRGDFDVLPQEPMEEVLTTWDVGVRFESPIGPERDLAGAFVVVRWTDRWDTRWEYKLGAVRQIQEDEPWER